jgi:Leucine-rich repeat (LRR) protein
MKCRILLAFTAWLVVHSVVCADDDSAIRELIKAGATVERDESKPDKPVRLVSWNLLEVTDDGLRALKEIEQLPAVELVGGGDTTLTPSVMRALQRKRSLKRLSISYATISDESAGMFGELSGLENLDLHAQVVCSPRGLNECLQLTNLEELTLSDRLVNEEVFDKLPKLRNLKVLNIRSIFVTDKGLASLPRMKSLQTLRICIGPDVTHAGLRQIGGLDLKELDVTYFNVTDADIAAVSKLTTVTALRLLNARQLTDAAIPHLREMIRLKELELIGASLTKERLAELRRALPGCKLTEGNQ